MPLCFRVEEWHRYIYTYTCICIYKCMYTYIHTNTVLVSTAALLRSRAAEWHSRPIHIHHAGPASKADALPDGSSEIVSRISASLSRSPSNQSLDQRNNVRGEKNVRLHPSIKWKKSSGGGTSACTPYLRMENVLRAKKSLGERTVGKTTVL